MRSQNSRARFVSTKGINNLNQITMETTKNKIEATYREAWICKLFLSVEFTFNELDLIATCVYYNRHGIDDVEVKVIGNPSIEFSEGDEEFEAGQGLLEEMDLKTYLTF